MRDRPSPPDPLALALAALGWILDDGQRAERFLALTGLTPDDLRRRVNDPIVLAAVLDFLLAHEPDLLRAAAELEVQPQAMAEARAELMP